MVSVHYDLQEDTFVGHTYPPKQNYLIPIIFLISLSTTVSLIVFYFHYNGEILQLHSIHSNSGNYSKRLVCYFNFPTTITDLQPNDIDANLCSHILVSFLNVSANHELEISKSQIHVLEKVNDLKSENPDLKVFISVGGAGNVKGWSEMVYNHTNRKRFIRSVRNFLESNRLDGIDLDWEYPDSSGVNNKEKIHFTQLLEEFRMHIDRNHYKFLLSVSAPSSRFRIDTCYQVDYLNKFSDFINVMSYDYHFFTSWTPFTGLNSPLVKSKLDNGIFNTLNINDTICYYLEKGMDKSKINVGLPTFGHSYALFNKYNNGLYSPAKGYGQIGSKGFTNYPDVFKFLNMENVTKYFDSTTKSPYATKELEWISFDDANSLRLKTQFILDHDLGGVAIYSLNADDFSGIFGGDFTLVRAVKNALYSCITC